MLHISTQRLIEKLLERTHNGTIDWKERSPDGVVLETEGYVVELLPNPASLRLLQSDGRLLEDVTPEILASTKNADDRVFSDIVAELLQEADRFAKGTEQAIASILDAVESSNTPILKKKVEPLVDVAATEEIEVSPPPFDEPEIEQPTDAAVPAEPALESEPTETIDAEVELPTEHDLPDEVEVPTSFEGSQENPDSEAGMSAAVSKMVAEVNGDYSDLDAAEAAALDLPPEFDTDTPETVVETAQTMESLDISVPDIEEEPEFKTHIISPLPEESEVESEADESETEAPSFVDAFRPFSKRWRPLRNATHPNVCTTSKDARL